MANQHNFPHPKHKRSFWSFWGHGFNKARKKSWDKYGGQLVFWTLVYCVATFFVSPQMREDKLWEFDMSHWLTIIIPSIALGGFLVYHLFRAPYEIYSEQFDKHLKEVESLESKIKELESAVDSMQEKKNAAKK